MKADKKRQKMGTVKMIAFMAAMAFATVAAPSYAADNWTGYTYAVVPTIAAVKGLDRIIEKVKIDTAGTLNIKLHLGGSLQIKSSDITQAVGDNIVQFADDGFFLGNVKIGGVLRLPMLINSDQEWQKAAKVMDPYLKKGFEKQGVVYLGQYRFPHQVIFTTFKIESLNDLKDRKIRVTSPEQGEFIKAFGGLPLTLAGTEVPTSLERGIVEGVVTASSGGAKGWHEFLKYNYRFGINYFNSVIIANRDAFNALPEKSKASLVGAVAAEIGRIEEEFKVDELKQMELQEKEGMAIVKPGPEEIVKAAKLMAPYWTEWATSRGPEFVEALTAVRQALDK